MRHSMLLAFAVVALAPPATAQAPAVVNVQLSNFKFTPREIVLDHGRSYVFRLRNASDGGHDFTARDFFAAANVAAEDRRLVSEGEVEVPPGQVRDIRLVAPAAGRYKLKCTHSMHKFFGMSGTIIVR